MGGLLKLICMRPSTEGVSPPEKMNWMHADLQIEVENGFSSIIEKRPSGMPGQIFLSTKERLFCQSRLDSHQLPLLLCLFEE